MPTLNDKTAPELADPENSGNHAKDLPDSALENIAAGAQDEADIFSDSDAMRESVEPDLKKLDEELLRLRKEK